MPAQNKPIKRNMKVLALYMTYFRLPDDFSGGISDALILMADYHVHAKQHTIPKTPPLDITLSEALGVTFDEFVDAVQTGKRLSGILQLKDFDPKVQIAHL